MNLTLLETLKTGFVATRPMAESNFFNVTYCFRFALKIRAIRMANPMTARTAEIFSGIKKESEIVQTVINKLYVDDKSIIR